jgi:GTPase SAR1 family protein
MNINDTVCLHKDVEDSILKWLINREKPAILLLGPPGIGKTTLALRVFKLAGLRTVEFNASHTRSGTSFRKTILPLLKEGGIVQMMESGKKGGIGIILDEIDGLSNGERGGLNELHTYLKSSSAINGLPLILISNSIDTRTLQQISKLCISFVINKVKQDVLRNWLNTDIPAGYNGDLRSLRRLIDGLEDVKEEFEYPEGVKSISSWALWGHCDPLMSFDIENNEGNLASLMCLENVPERIKASLGDTEEAWKLYTSIFDAYKISDQGDFWAFFYQCWAILPISLRLKLKIMSLRLANEAPITDEQKEPESRYTPVLTKQSAMFNAWKLICEISENESVPVRLSPMYSEHYIMNNQLKPEKLRRYQSISLENLYRLITEK